MPKILHEQTGLTIKRNDHNGFVVCSLHFTADPAKREAWWAKEAAAGMPPSEFEREYNLKYITASGQKVFPEFVAHRAKIVVEQAHAPTVPSTQICYGGFDFGLRNQTSFHVYTVLPGPTNELGEVGEPTIYALWEHYATTTSLQELAETLKACPYWSQIKWIAADRHLQSKDQIDMTGPHSKLDQLRNVDIGKKMIMAPSNESDWIALMRDYWYDLERRPARFCIFSNCVNMIREFDDAVFQDMTEGVQVNHNLKEVMRDKNNHALDDCKYFMLTGPRLKGALQTEKAQVKRAVELWRRHML